MKTRNGFISNSSTSSFILSCENKETTIIIPVEIDLLDYGNRIKDEEKLKEVFKNDYDYDPEKNKDQDGYSYEQEKYEDCLKEIQNDKCIIIGEFDNHSTDPIKLLLLDKITPLPKGVKLIADPS